MDELTKDEKFNLMIGIMEDLRGDWSDRCEERANKVKELAKELGHKKTVKLVDSYFKYVDRHGDADGRFFRCSFKDMGGYEDAPDKLAKAKTFTKAYIKAIKDNCNYPEYRLNTDL